MKQFKFLFSTIMIFVIIISFCSCGSKEVNSNIESPATEIVVEGNSKEEYTESESRNVTTENSKTQITTKRASEGKINSTKKQNKISAWVKASEAPKGAEIVKTSWDYREYTTSLSSLKNGWIKDDSKTSFKVNWDGVVSYFDNKQQTNETFRYVGTKEVENGTKTYLYRYYSPTYNSFKTYKADSTYREDGYWVSSYYSYDIYKTGQDLYMSDEIKNIGSDYPCWKGETKTIYKTQYGYQSGTKVYTYSFYKDVYKITSDPTGKKDVSNVVKYVKYVID